MLRSQLLTGQSVAHGGAVGGTGEGVGGGRAVVDEPAGEHAHQPTGLGEDRLLHRVARPGITQTPPTITLLYRNMPLPSCLYTVISLFYHVLGCCVYPCRS